MIVSMKGFQNASIAKNMGTAVEIVQSQESQEKMEVVAEVLALNVEKKVIARWIALKEERWFAIIAKKKVI